MPRLSIIITSCGNTDLLEASLVSVLSNRPADAEVLVVSSAPYDDPYELAGEVRFIEVRAGAGWTELANAGVASSAAPVVHLLAAGVEASDGWTDTALAHLADPQVAAVVPVVYGDAQRKRALAAGVSYGCGGTRRAVRGRAARLKPEWLQRRVVGPTHWAGFYRKGALAAPVGGFSTAVGDEAADVELGLRLRQAGYRVVVEPESAVFAVGVKLPRPTEFARAAGAERLFWRHVGLSGWWPAVGWHALAATGSMVGSLLRLAIVGQLAGRAVGMVDQVRHARYRRELLELPGTAEAAQRDLLSLETRRGRRRSAVAVGSGGLRKSA